MATEVVMPRLSDSMVEGTILEWKVPVGAEVDRGDELVEIETDKATMVYEATAAGTVIEILAGNGETRPVGALIARIGGDEEVPRGADAPERDRQDVEPADGSRAADDLRVPSETVGRRNRNLASPLARRLAADQDIALDGVRGSGPGGRIVKRDVEALIGSRRSGPQPEPRSGEEVERSRSGKGTIETVEPSRVQRLTARRMAESKATAPHIYLNKEIDMSQSVRAREHLRSSRPRSEGVPSYNDMVVRACALALRSHPQVNGAYVDGKFELYSRINVGIAVAAQNGLMVPTVFDADLKDLDEIAADTRGLSQRVREGTITPPELSGGTFTVSNLGMHGIRSFSPVLNPPQAAILAVGAIAQRPGVYDGHVTAVSAMEVTLACDHRILSGAEGAEFLAAVELALTAPAVVGIKGRSM